MHIKRQDLGTPQAVPEGTILRYPVQSQDCRSLERFAICTVLPGRQTLPQQDPERETFWIVTGGAGTVTRGDEEISVGARDLIIIPPGIPHALNADDTVEFLEVAFNAAILKIAAEALEAGVGDPHGDHVEGRPLLIRGDVLPPQEGDSCYRYPHARPHSTLDHWDQNSTEPGSRAADHVHEDHEEFWYLCSGAGQIEHDGRHFAVGAGDLIGHPPGVHHTLIAEKEPIRWYCFCMNRWLMPLVGDALARA